MVRTKDIFLVLLIIAALFLATFTYHQYVFKSVTTISVEDSSNPTDQENETSDHETPNFEKLNNTIYYVYWPICKEIFPMSDSFFVYKNEPFTLTIKIPEDNLRSVMFKLKWEDDFDLKTSLFDFGRDTLTFSIKSPDGIELYEKKSIGEGTICFTEGDINSKPSITTIEASNESDAWKNLTKQ